MGQKKASQILPILYSTINAPDNLTEALDQIADVTLSCGVMQFSFNQIGFKYSSQSSNSPYKRFEKEIAYYSKKYFEYDQQAMGKLLRTPVGKPLFDVDVWPNEPDLKNREDILYTREVLGFYRRMGFNLSPHIGWNSGIFLQYAEKYEDIPQEGVANAKELIPHLAQINELSRFVAKLQSAYNAVYTVLDRIKIGMVIFDKNQNLAIMNTAAQHIFEDKDGLYFIEGKVKLASADLNKSFKNSLKAAVSTSAGKGNIGEHIIIIDRPSLRSPYVISLSALKDGKSEIEVGFHGAIALIFDTDSPPDIDVSSLAEVAGFTPAETHIARYLIKGHIDREISDIRNTSIETTRTQIKQVLAKVGVKNRVGLVRRAAMITPPIE